MSHLQISDGCDLRKNHKYGATICYEKKDAANSKDFQFAVEEEFFI